MVQNTSFDVQNVKLSLHLCYERIHSHSSGSTLDPSMGHQSPVVPLAGAERTPPCFLVNLHLKRLHVCLIFLIGCKAYPWERQREGFLVITFHFCHFSHVLQWHVLHICSYSWTACKTCKRDDSLVLGNELQNVRWKNSPGESDGRALMWRSTTIEYLWTVYWVQICVL